MSHYTVTVVVDDPDVEVVGEAMAPYDENGEWFAEGSRWDWWVVGGRWSDLLVDKSGEHVDYARKREVDWEAMAQEQVHALRDEYRAHHHLTGKPPFYFDESEKPQPGESEDAFVQRRFEPFATHALLDRDGKWHENGRMGWFGTVIEDEDGEGEHETWPAEYQRLLAEVPDDAWLVIVDAHV